MNNILGRGSRWSYLVVLVGLLSGGLFVTGPARADLGEAGGKVEAGSAISHFRYEEPDFMEQNGLMYGVFGRYTYRIQQNEKLGGFSDLFSSGSTLNTFGVDGRITFGSMDYESSGTGTVDNINDFILEVRGTAGYDFPVGEDSLLTPYLGLGYRYWNDQMGGKVSTTGHFGYDRESNYFYLPIGIGLATALSNGWSLGFKAEFDVFLDGQQKSHLEDVSPALSTLDNDQSNGYGLRGSVSLTKKGEGVDFVVEPFVRYWNIDESNFAPITCGGFTCAFGYEPNNESTEIGVELGARF